MIQKHSHNKMAPNTEIKNEKRKSNKVQSKTTWGKLHNLFVVISWFWTPMSCNLCSLYILCISSIIVCAYTKIYRIYTIRVVPSSTENLIYLKAFHKTDIALPCIYHITMVHIYTTMTTLIIITAIIPTIIIIFKV